MSIHPERNKDERYYDWLADTNGLGHDDMGTAEHDPEAMRRNVEMNGRTPTKALDQEATRHETDAAAWKKKNPEEHGSWRDIFRQ
jgi:hypothetical protein